MEKIKQKIIYRGAEAVIFKFENKIVKDRVKKSYRLPEIDLKIRAKRTKKEAKLLDKASEIINSPIPEQFKDEFKIIMPYIQGKKLSEHLDTLSNKIAVCRQIGEQIAKLHDNNIIHGDLTTSNMILVKKSNNPNLKLNQQLKKDLTLKDSKSSEKLILDNNKISVSDSEINADGMERGGEYNDKVYFIDFGLGFNSLRNEDKAVDLHLIKQALEAKHFQNWEKYWKAIESSYKKASKKANEVLEKLKVVESRGRYKERY